MSPRFRYGLDPLCLGALTLYVVNRFLIKPALPHYSWFFHGHLDDMLLVPVALPLFLGFYRWIGLRVNDQPPYAWEVALHVTFWALFFEVIGPKYWHHGTSDVWDAISYGLGGLAAWIFWRYSSALVSPGRLLFSKNGLVTVCAEGISLQPRPGSLNARKN